VLFDCRSVEATKSAYNSRRLSALVRLAIALKIGRNLCLVNHRALHLLQHAVCSAIDQSEAERSDQSEAERSAVRCAVLRCAAPCCAALRCAALSCPRMQAVLDRTGQSLAGSIYPAVRLKPQTDYSTVQYSTVQYSTVQYSTVQYSTVQYSTVQYSRRARRLICSCCKSTPSSGSMYRHSYA
jgi:hypothetical protein